VGFISNQWLNKGMGLRNRGYHPVSVTITASPPVDDSWSQHHRVTAEITATRENSEYQTVHLTRAEAEKLATLIVSLCGETVRKRLALQILKTMSTTKLLETFATILKMRLRDAPSRVQT